MMSQYEDVTRRIVPVDARNIVPVDARNIVPVDARNIVPVDARKIVPSAIAGPVQYGKLIVLGVNGDEDRTKSHFVLNKRPMANGWKPSAIHMGVNQSISAGDQHRVTYITPVTTVVVEHCRDKQTDMFQIGRGVADTSLIDFPVTDTVAQSDGTSRISRFACRIICQRSGPPHRAHICAAGFDNKKNIFLGLDAVKWETTDRQMDALTTNGVLVKCPSGAWREISVRGHAFAPREPRYCGNRGIRVDGYEPQELMDGSLIDLGGVTLLWRTAEGLAEVSTSSTDEATLQLYQH